MSDLRQCQPPLGSARAARPRARRTAFSAALLVVLAGCHTPLVRVTPLGPAPPPPDTQGLDDGLYDWHGLVIAPFGSGLKDVHLTLHEVLLFQDDSHRGAAADDAECYSADAPAPRLLGRTPDEHLLCFKQDHLSRIQASVRLSTDAVSEVFATACAAWLKHAARATTLAAASNTAAPSAAQSSVATPSADTPGAKNQSGVGPGTGTSGADAQSADTCKGQDGAIRFSGRLGEEPGRVETPQAQPPQTETPQPGTVLSITLDSVATP